MLLLSGHSLTPARKVPLEALSLDITERDSTATMIPTDMSSIGVDSWFQDDTNPGAGIVWRVKSISQAFATDTPTIELEHVINSLRDNIMFGEITPATITGNPKATTCTADQAIRFILSYQSDWVLGSFDYAYASNPYKFDGDTLFDALELVSNSLSDAWWSYDTTVYPFRLNINIKSARTDTEMRAGRNLTTITKTIDKSQMFTRFYPIGKDDLHIPGNYVEQNANIYGVVSKVETDTTIDSVEELIRWARERLAGHCVPTVTIEVEGFELADATGESLDRMQLGYYCRVPLEEFDTEIQERIIRVNYPDKLNSPKLVKLTLANNITDIVRIVADAVKNGSGGKGGRGAARQQKEDHAWFEDTDEHVAMVAESIVGTGPDAWQRISQLVVDGEGIHAKVVRNENGLVTAFTQIDANEQRILLEAQRASAAEGQLSGRITVEADRITQEVTQRKAGEEVLSSRITVEAGRITQEVNDRRNSEATLSSRITQTANAITAEVTRATAAEGTIDGKITVEAGKITQIVSAVGKDGQVTAASICLAINNGGSTATINANKIYLLGDTIANTITADYIQTKIASLASLNVAAISSERGSASMYGINTTTFSQGGVTCYVPNAVNALNLKDNGDSTYTLQKKSFNEEAWVDVGTFSRAISGTTLSGAWSGRNYTVTATPQGNTQTGIVYDGIVPDGTATYYTAYDHHYVKQNFKVFSDDGSGNADAQILVKELSILADDAYTAGVNSGEKIWSYSNSASTGSSSPGGGAKTYSFSKNYSYAWFNVTCNGESKRIIIHLLS